MRGRPQLRCSSPYKAFLEDDEDDVELFDCDDVELNQYSEYTTTDSHPVEPIEEATDTYTSGPEEQSSIQALYMPDELATFLDSSQCLSISSGDEDVSESWETSSFDVDVHDESIDWEVLSDVASVKSYDVLCFSYADALQRYGLATSPVDSEKKVNTIRKYTLTSISERPIKTFDDDSSELFSNIFSKNDPFAIQNIVGHEKTRHRGRKSGIKNGKARWKRY